MRLCFIFRSQLILERECPSCASINTEKHFAKIGTFFSICNIGKSTRESESEMQHLDYENKDFVFSCVELGGNIFYVPGELV